MGAGPSPSRGRGLQRVALIFPPLANPTYVPLGMASLAASLRQTLPGLSVALYDANLEDWLETAGQGPDGDALVRGMQGRQGNFFDEPSYRILLDLWQRLHRVMQARQDAIRALLDGEIETGSAIRERLGQRARRVLAGQPDLVGLSVVFPGQLVGAVALAQAIRQEADGPRPRLVLGGASLSALRPDELLRFCPFIDALVLGEGEAGLAALCRGEPDALVPGLVVRDGLGLRMNPRQDAGPMDGLPTPDFSGLPLDQYLNPEPVLPVLATRGCRHRGCRFCSHVFTFEGYRYRNAIQVVNDFEYLVEKHAARHFYLADQYLEPRLLLAVAEEILRRGLSVRLHALGLVSAEYTPALLDRCAEAGLCWLSWGVESGSQRLLDLMNKRIRADRVPTVLAQARRAGISNLVMLIFGLPGSTDEDLEATFRLLEAIYPDVDAFTASSFVLFEGTVIERHPERYGLHIDGALLALGRDGQGVRSTRLLHREIAQDGSLRPPRGPLEVAAWERRRAWLGEPGLFQDLGAEHYLLFAGRRRDRPAR